MRVALRASILTGQLLVCGFAQAQTTRLDFDQGVSAAEAGNYAEAFCIWKPLANVGHADAQYRLGWLYAKGLGLAENVQQALGWWQLAADLGHADALFSIGWVYHHGEGVERDIEKALRYYLEASRHGQHDAAEILQEMSMNNDRRVTAGLARLLADSPDVLGERAKVVVKRANVRKNADKNSKLLATLAEGDGLVVLGNKGNWLRVWLQQQQRFGWIFRRLVKLEPVRQAQEKP